jgi:hypothetical protein
MKLENNNFNISDNTRFILSDPLLINYLENEFIKLDIDTIKNINILIYCLSNNDIYNENITWFMNLIGNSLKNNITSISANIPDKYKYLYEFNNTVEYIYKINKIFNFINKFDKYSLLEPIYVIILDKLIICIENCDFIELLTFIDKYSLLVNKIFEDMNSERIFRLRHINKNLIINKKSENYLGIYNKKIIIDAISNNINKQLVNINIFSYDKIILLLELVIKCKDLNLLENYILLIFENKKIINSILDIIHERINSDTSSIINLIILIKNKIKNKDQFMNIYHKLLIERILSNEINIENEELIINEETLEWSNQYLNDFLVCKVQDIVNLIEEKNTIIKNLVIIN